MMTDQKCNMRYKGVVYDNLFVTRAGDCFYLKKGVIEPMPVQLTGKNRSYKSISIKMGNKYHLALLHRVLYETFIGDLNGVIDHIDRNSLNNDLSNLRLVTQQQNTWNRGVSSRSSLGLKGIADTGKSYRVEVTKDGKKHFMGNYRTLKEACKAYNQKAIELHGEFAYQHDIENIRIKKKVDYNYCLDI